MLTSLSIHEFLEQVSASKPTPGGGCVAALQGALAASLVEMVAKLSLNKQYGSAETMTAIAQRAHDLRQMLKECVENDAEAYNAVILSFRLPKTTDAEKSARNDAIQSAFKQAAAIPLQVATQSIEVLDMAYTLIQTGLPNAVSDATVAAMSARTAVLAAICNVDANLPAIQDAAFADNLRRNRQHLKTVLASRSDDWMA